MTVSDFVRLSCLIGAYILGQKDYAKKVLKSLPAPMAEYFQDIMKDFDAHYVVDEQGEHLVITNKKGGK